MKPEIEISIMPTYLCNYRCEYCYNGDLCKDKTVLSIKKLSQRLEEINKYYNISQVCVYGGEISLLSQDYLKEVLKQIRLYTNGIIGFITNGSNLDFIDFCLKNDIGLSISLNEERSNYENTISVIKNLKNKEEVTLTVVVTPSIINADINKLFEFYKSLGVPISFIMYHPSVNSKVSYDFDTTKEFTDFLQKAIIASHKFGVIIRNEDILLKDEFNPKTEGYLFITPYGKFSSVEFKNGIEHFIEFNTIEDWQLFAKQKDLEYFKNCCCCEFYGKCKAEHIIHTNTEYCSGLKKLINWYKDYKNGSC